MAKKKKQLQAQPSTVFSVDPPQQFSDLVKVNEVILEETACPECSEKTLEHAKSSLIFDETKNIRRQDLWCKKCLVHFSRWALGESVWYTKGQSLRLIVGSPPLELLLSDWYIIYLYQCHCGGNVIHEWLDDVTKQTTQYASTAPGITNRLFCTSCKRELILSKKEPNKPLSLVSEIEILETTDDDDLFYSLLGD